MKMAHTELCLRERRTIEDMLNAKMSVDKIAAEIGRHRSTVFREIKRNHFSDESMPKHDGYYGAATQLMVADRRTRRWFLPKHEIRSMTDQDMKEISDRLNNTQRKCLGSKTPSGVFREKMMEELR